MSDNVKEDNEKENIEKIWTVYIHTVPKELSGYEWDKRYVGITSRNPKERWRKGLGYKKNNHFYRAITKYGWDNIEHEIFKKEMSKDNACELEKLLIKVFRSNDYHYGYNICSGGEGCTGLIGEKNSNYGRKWSKEERQRMSEYKKAHPSIPSEQGRLSKSNFMKNRWKDPEYRSKNAPCYGRTGENHPMFGKHNTGSEKAVICLNTGEIFRSATEASKQKGVNHSKLCMCCRGERNSSGKDILGNPLKWMYYKDYLLKVQNILGGENYELESFSFIFQNFSA